jgi:hypothetical protein
MRSVWLIAIALFSLSGCIDNSTSLGSENDGEPTIITDPADFKNGTKNGTHAHDYWGGRDQIEIINTTFQLLGGLGEMGFSFRPIEGEVVRPGTSGLTVYINWTVGPLSSLPKPTGKLLVKTAADGDYSKEYAITNGEPTLIESTNELNDIAHAGKSSWQFKVNFGDQQTDPNFHFTQFQVSATTTRGLEIPILSAHPDLWQGRNEYPLFDNQDDITAFQTPVAFGSPDPIETQRPDKGVLVPWDASEILVELTQSGAPTATIQLRYQDTQTYEWKNADGETAGDTTTYRISVNGAGDSPYALQSQWEFIPIVDSGTQGLANAWDGSIQISAVVQL